MLQSIMNRLMSPAAWVVGLIRFGAYRFLETRNVAGLGDIISAGSSS